MEVSIKDLHSCIFTALTNSLLQAYVEDEMRKVDKTSCKNFLPLFLGLNLRSEIKMDSKPQRSTRKQREMWLSVYTQTHTHHFNKFLVLLEFFQVIWQWKRTYSPHLANGHVNFALNGALSF